MRTKEQKEKHAAYMREYNRKNREKVNKRRRENLKKCKEENPDKYKAIRDMANKANAKYYDANKDEINARAKERNWNYDPEKAKIKRAKHYRKHPAQNVLRPRKAFAKKHNLPFDLTPEWYYDQFELGCSVTGIPFDDNGTDSPWVPHIDRIIPEKGYVKENCRLVCACYNLAKKHWTDDDVIQMSIALLEHTFKE